MKRFFAVMIAIVAIFALNGTAKACSNEPISATNTIVKIALDPHYSRAIMTLVAKDAKGETLCKFDEIYTTTSRNKWPYGPAERKDHVRIYRQGGVALVVFISPKEFAGGTTVYLEGNRVALGNPDGMPFMYTYNF